MNYRLTKRIATAALCVATFACAQDPELHLDALDHGTLIIWVIRPPAEKRPKDPNAPRFNAAQPGYRESTISTLGQPASSFGQDAGSYGLDSGTSAISAPSSPTSTNARAPGDTTPAGSGYTEVTGSGLGQSAGTFGENQSDHGQSTGSFGKNASTAGTNAGSYGTTLSNFGESLSTLGQAKKQTTAVTFHLPTRTMSSSMFEQEIHSAFPALKVIYSDVFADELANDLAAASYTHSSPDLIIGFLRSAGWQKMEGRFGAGMVHRAQYVPDGVSEGDRIPEYALVANAPHATEARAFILWASEVNGGCLQCGVGTVATDLTAEEQKVATAAAAALGHLYTGGGVGAVADPALAVFSSQLGTNVMSNDVGQVVNEGAHQNIVHVSMNGALAAVTARVVVASGGEYGVAHPLIVLRKNSNAKLEAQWRVLHISLNLPSIEAERARQELTSETSPPQRDERQQGVKAVSLIAPTNNDTRSPQPDLSWENFGGAGLQVIEWTECNSECQDTHLYFVPDRSDHLRTQANAEFARAAGNYKWRVISVGDKGAIALSPWRTFHVQL